VTQRDFSIKWNIKIYYYKEKHYEILKYCFWGGGWGRVDQIFAYSRFTQGSWNLTPAKSKEWLYISHRGIVLYVELTGTRLFVHHIVVQDLNVRLGYGGRRRQITSVWRQNEEDNIGPQNGQVSEQFSLLCLHINVNTGISLYNQRPAHVDTLKLVCKAVAWRARFIVQLPSCRLARIITNWKEPGLIFMTYFRV
jgi:hypothetical protein